jgi:Holliday junction resolvase
VRRKKVKNRGDLKSTPKYKNLGKRNRTAGQNFERKVAKDLRELGYTAVRTSREASRLLDNAKVDLAGIKLKMQLKYVKTSINYVKLLSEIQESVEQLIPSRKDYPTIILHKREKNTLAIMSLEDLYVILGDPSMVEKWKE